MTIGHKVRTLRMALEKYIEYDKILPIKKNRGLCFFFDTLLDNGFIDYEGLSFLNEKVEIAMRNRENKHSSYLFHPFDAKSRIGFLESKIKEYEQ